MVGCGPENGAPLTVAACSRAQEFSCVRAHQMEVHVACGPWIHKKSQTHSERPERRAVFQRASRSGQLMPMRAQLFATCLASPSARCCSGHRRADRPGQQGDRPEGCRAGMQAPARRTHAARAARAAMRTPRRRAHPRPAGRSVCGRNGAPKDGRSRPLPRGSRLFCHQGLQQQGRFRSSCI
jgi:hypothetical protein